MLCIRPRGEGQALKTSNQIHRNTNHVERERVGGRVAPVCQPIECRPLQPSTYNLDPFVRSILASMARASSPGSVYTVSSDEASDYAPESSHSGRAAKRPRISGSKRKLSVKASKPIACAALGAKAETDDIEDSLQYVHRPHASGYHAVDRVAELQQDLLNWFERVREKRGMPWRKAYDPSLTMEQKGQRAYEIWVSEVMLQQTQVTTVIAYWQKWIAKWPTIADLAEADIEKVNSAWRKSSVSQ